VRDNGLASSIEFRVPILFDRSGKGMVQLAPFFDFGGSWNVDGSPSPTTIYSTGIGILITPRKYFDAQLYWGYRLRHVELPDDNPQDLGLTFQVSISTF